MFAWGLTSDYFSFPFHKIYGTTVDCRALLKFLDSSLQISQKLYEPYIKQVPVFKGCSTGFIKQIVSQSSVILSIC